MADHKKENPLEETIEELFVDPDARKPAKTPAPPQTIEAEREGDRRD